MKDLKQLESKVIFESAEFEPMQTELIAGILEALEISIEDIKEIRADRYNISITHFNEWTEEINTYTGEMVSYSNCLGRAVEWSVKLMNFYNEKGCPMGTLEIYNEDGTRKDIIEWV